MRQGGRAQGLRSIFRWQVLRRAAAGMLAVILAACTSLPQEGGSLVLPTPDSLSMHCANWAKVSLGPYRVQNNTWGKGKLTGWKQCVGLGIGQDQSAVARFTWDWPQAGRGIKAYPAIIYGRKPGALSTASTLPHRINALKALRVDYSVSVSHQGAANIAFDIWLTQTNSPSAFSAPPITHEIMIWLDSFGGVIPEGAYLETTEIDGTLYDVHMASKHGGGWQYIAFNPQVPQLGQRSTNIHSFLTYVQNKGHLTGQEYVASVELGSEIESGRGELKIEHFEVRVVQD